MKKSHFRSLQKNRNNLTLRTLYNITAHKCRELEKQDALRVEKKFTDYPNTRKYYKFISRKLKYRQTIPDLVTDTGYSVSTDSQKAEVLNNQFGSVFITDNGILPNTVFHHDVPLARNILFNEFIVQKWMKTIPEKFYIGPDGLCPYFLKRIAPSIVKPVCTIFTLSFYQSVIPRSWLSARIVPVHKKNMTPSLPSSYRPISLTCALSKVMESIIRSQIIDHFVTNNLFSNNQHGFLPKRSTCTQLLSCLNDWTKAVDDGSGVDIIYLDFAKAFDTVSHIKLLEKLRCYRLNDMLISWITQFLSNRTQTVVVNDSVSTVCNVTSGIPQGSVLGPVLFVIYINDIVDIVKDSQIKLYADDSKLYIRSNRENFDKLTADLDSVFRWTQSWQLQLALSKCKHIHLGSPDFLFSYYISTDLVENVTSMKDLGVTVTTNCSFREHIMNVTRKAGYTASSIFRNFVSRNPTFLLSMFITYVRPILEYNCSVWSPGLVCDIDLVEHVQRSFTRRIPGLSVLSYKERLEHLHLDSLEKRRMISDLCEVYKMFFGLSNLRVTEFFTLHDENINTRGHPYRVLQCHYNMNIRKFSFAVRVAPIWNFLPSTVFEGNYSNVSTFRQKLKALDLSRFLRGSGVRS